ncbi:KRAB [Mytilus edulis]|uniref:KRAB n=1 Tax=Mytilus edulis TaxID=6550 RepID=A0A8S3UEG4_MYTED|nr:KRAB [Mytilus edulis]
MRSSPNNCHCVETGHNGQSGQQTDPPTTGAPVSTMFITKSELLNGLNRSPCMADTQGILNNIDGNLETVTQGILNNIDGNLQKVTQVWDLIYNIRKPECRHAAAEIVHALHSYKYESEHCDRHFGSKYQHIKYTLRSYKYESDHCDKHFVSKYQHIKYILRAYKYESDHCGRHFCSNKHFGSKYQHIKYTLRSYKYESDHCDKHFGSKYQHIKYTLRSYKYDSDHCGRHFTLVVSISILSIPYDLTSMSQITVTDNIVE